MTNEDLAYVAGIFDGEGHIQITETNGRKKYRRVQVRMTSYECLKFIYDTIPSGRLHMDSSPSRAIYSNKQLYVLYYHTNHGRDFLQLVLPWLIIKKNQAIEYIEKK